MRFMNSPEALERLQKVRCFVLDMDGTFYLDTQIIPGSLEFYHAMLASGRQILFLTNNSSHDATHYVNRLQGMGVPVKREQIYTSDMPISEPDLSKGAGISHGQPFPAGGVPALWNMPGGGQSGSGCRRVRYGANL